MTQDTKSVVPVEKAATPVAPLATAPAAVPAATVAATATGTNSFYGFNTAKAAVAVREEISKVSQSAGVGGKGGGRSVLSLNVCCAAGNRKSLKLSKSLYEELFGEVDEDSEPRQLQVLRDGMNLYISEEFPEDTDSFPFSNSTSMMVYNAALVLWMVEAFGLNFSGGRTSNSYQQVKIITPDKDGKEKPYAIIDMSKPLKK